LKQLKVLSLFSGCGGMDLGFEGGFKIPKPCINREKHSNLIEKEINDFFQLKETKFNTIFANDLLDYARDSWVHNFKKYGYSEEVFHQESIVDIVEKHKNGQNIFPDEVDVVTGGFPCKDFSIAGNREGFDSTVSHNGNKKIKPTVENRGKLYIWMKKVIEITKPNIFIAENVKGLTNIENVMDVIQEDFSSVDDNGYLIVKPKVLHAADYGVSQSRERVFFIGLKKSALDPEIIQEIKDEEINIYPDPTHSYTVNRKELKKTVKLKNILSLVNEPENSNDPSHKNYSKAKYMGDHCQGQIEVDLEGIAPTIRSEHHGNIEFRRLAKEHGGEYHDELREGKKERRLTPRECALIQSFPPDFDFVIPDPNNRGFLITQTKAYKLIGNAVPPLLAFHIANKIERMWQKLFSGGPHSNEHESRQTERSSRRSKAKAKG
jgi:DNA (cytosine-5)-methyltransferase 1